MYMIRLNNGLTLPYLYSTAIAAESAFRSMSADTSFVILKTAEVRLSETLRDPVGDMEENLRERIGPNSFFDDLTREDKDELRALIAATIDEWVKWRKLNLSALQAVSETKTVNLDAGT